MQFKELSTKAQSYAIKDYIKGWQETHDEELDPNEVRLILEENTDEVYNKQGKYKGKLL